jgi:hypothetical protein
LALAIERIEKRRPLASVERFAGTDKKAVFFND